MSVTFRENRNNCFPVHAPVVNNPVEEKMNGGCWLKDKTSLATSSAVISAVFSCQLLLWQH